jgi:hypothetical protein
VHPVNDLEARVAALEAEVRVLHELFKRVATAEAIMRRAGMPEPIREVAERKAARSHLRPVQ